MFTILIMIPPVFEALLLPLSFRVLFHPAQHPPEREARIGWRLPARRTARIGKEV